MQRYIAVRFVQAIIALLILSVVTFALARASGNPLHLMLPAEATAEDYERLSRRLGLDQPYHVQFAVFITSAIRGDFGTSLRAKRPVGDLIRDRFPNSIKLASLSMALTLLAGIPMGVLAAVRRGTFADWAVRVVAALGQSLPAFWVGIMAIELFSVRLGWLPTSGMDGPANYVLPAVTLAAFVLAGITRLLRSSMLEVLDSDFVKLARIKGASERAIIWKHALRNALIPVVTFAGMYFAILITMSVVVEVVFAWPGVGRLAYEGIFYRDYPIVQGVVLTAAALVITMSLITDILYAYLDPRIRRQTA